MSEASPCRRPAKSSLRNMALGDMGAVSSVESCIYSRPKPQEEL